MIGANVFVARQSSDLAKVLIEFTVKMYETANEAEGREYETPATYRTCPKPYKICTRQGRYHLGAS